MDKENINGTDPVKTNDTESPKGGQAAHTLSLRDQVRMISDGSYTSTMSDRAASSRADDFDLNSRLTSLENAPAQDPVQEAEESVGLKADGVDVYDDRFSIRRANVRSFSAVKKNQPVKKKNGKPVHKRTVAKKHIGAGKIIGRILICIITAVLLAGVSAYALAYTIAHGPSITARNTLVLNAKQASATKWIPELVLSKDVVDEIVENSLKSKIEQIDIAEYNAENGHTAVVKDSDEKVVEEDIWAKAKDGMLFETVHGSTYKAYILRVKDPSRIYVATSSDDYANAKYGMTLFKCVEKYNCIAAINGGEFSDLNGMGTGAQPMGLTYSQGNLVWDDGHNDRTFIGFDAQNNLVLREGMTKEEAASLGIRDAVCFQTGNVLIDSADGKVNIHYYDGDISTSQRTAIGQCADGSVILLVTDGRSTSSLGATKNDVIDMMIERGAINAAMLDGGSSTMMYYRGYAEKYGIDTSTLDEYQKQGMVNKFKAFTEPRYIPTYFAVKEEATANEG